MRVQQTRVERRDIEIFVRQHDSHGAVDDAILPVHETRRLVGIPRVVAGRCELRVCQVELRAPRDKSRRARRCRSHVRVVGPNSLAGSVVLEQHFLTRETQGLGLVARDSDVAVIATGIESLAAPSGEVRDRRVSDAFADVLGAVLGGVVGRVAVDVGVVKDVQGGEVLPCEAGGVLRAGGDVGGKHGPSP